MSFASPIFLWYFMPALLLSLWLLPRSARNLLVAAFSLLFYAWGGKAYTFLLFSAILVNYAAGLAIDHERMRSRFGLRRLFLLDGHNLAYRSSAFWPSGSTPASPVGRLTR